MSHLIDKSALVAEIKKKKIPFKKDIDDGVYPTYLCALMDFEDFIDTLEVKEVDLIIHTIITECCDWLAMNTNLSHDEIEGCRNLMLTVKDEQLKPQEGEEDINSPEECSII